MCIVLLLAGAIPAQAHTTIVPDDFPTIQAAVDHVAIEAPVETLLVRGGSYPERVVIRDHSMVVLAIPPLDGSDRMPDIAELHVGGSSGYVFTGLHFTGQVYAESPGDCLFAGCRFDDYFYGSDRLRGPLTLARCTFFQGVLLGGLVTTLDSSAVYGPVFILDWADSACIIDNRFENIEYRALTVRGARTLVARNRVLGGGAFEAYTQGRVRFEANDIEGCRSGGIYCDATSRGSNVSIERNRIAHCRYLGWEYFGIRVLGRGTVRGNTVLDCSGPGIDVELQLGEGAGTVEDNVVGRCDLSGIRMTNTYPGLRLPGLPPPTMSVRGNTFYACKGPGIEILSLPGSTISNNLVYACQDLSSIDSDPLLISRNDWFPALAGQASPMDMSVDPLFCDLSADDVQLRSDSPLLDVPGAGRIGALGVGCEAPPVVIELELKQDVLPSGAHGGWVTAWLEPHAPFAASDVEIASVRLNGVPAASDGRIGDRDRDGIPDLQLRFDREAVGQTLGRGAVATLTVTGTMRGRQLIGTETVRIPHGQSLHRPTDLDPDAGAPVLSLGTPSVGSVSSALRVTFSLADGARARLELLDVAGRVVLSQEVGGAGPGEHTMDLGGRGRLAQGIYFLRIRQGAAEARTRAAIVR